jgi:hypothetical protein
MKTLMIAVMVATTLSCAAGLAWAQAKPSPATPQLDSKREADVLELLGPPDARIIEPDRVIWLYNRKVRNGAGERAYPEIRFVNGQVRSIQWLSERRMDDRLRDAKR